MNLKEFYNSKLYKISLKEFYQNLKESDEGDDLEAKVLQDEQGQIEQQLANQEQPEEEDNIQGIKNSFENFSKSSAGDQIKIIDNFLSNIAGM